MENSLENFKVILVDDDAEDIELFKEAFDSVRIKSELSFFQDGAQALEQLSDSNSPIPHILFLDLNMPKMGGIEMLEKLRKIERLKKLPVAIYSTSSSDSDIEDTLALGANIYIVKPNDFGKLRKVIETVMKIQWQYETSSLDTSRYLMVID